MSKDLWLIEYEIIGDEFSAWIIDEAEARDRLKRLGFDPDEIDEHLQSLQS